MWGRLLLIAAATVALGAKKTDADLKAQAEADVAALLAAADPAKGPPMREPVFAKGPKNWEFLGPPGPYYPDRAARMGQGGAAVVQCVADARGQLNDCKVLAVAPADFGFDHAALRMAKARHLTVTPDAAGSTEQPVRVLVQFPRVTNWRG